MGTIGAITLAGVLGLAGYNDVREYNARLRAEDHERHIEARLDSSQNASYYQQGYQHALLKYQWYLPMDSVEANDSLVQHWISDGY